MAGREYQLEGESGALFNGARDTEGGVWVRIKDEPDRRILAAAVDKQKKNATAAGGTLSALDPAAAHLVDYVGASLDRTLEAINGARPPGAQLDGTPMGAAIANNGDATATASGKKGKGDGKRGGKMSTVGEVLARVEGGPLDRGAPAGGITWADNVPEPRPVVGDRLRVPGMTETTTIVNPIGFDGEAHAFRVVDSKSWDGLVTWHADTGEWRIMKQLLAYTDEDDTRALALAANKTPDSPAAEAAGAAAAEETIAEENGDDSDDVAEPVDEPEPSAQRQRNARAAGVKKAAKTAKKAPARDGAKKRR